jgi:predicted RNase H-like HicB family nuclease
MRINKREMKLPVIIIRGEDGYFVAEIPLIPGCISQGKTRKEALANIKEAAKLCLESMAEEGWNLPSGYTLEQVEIGA